MISHLSFILLACFGGSLVLITLSLWLLRRAEPAGTGYSTGARFFLIVLRVFIGWHCFVEGMEKLASPSWSSETYLRESMGPLAEYYRAIPGDRLVDKATLGKDGEFPDELERAWRDYFNAFTAYYDLDDEQMARAETIFAQRKTETAAYLKSKVEKTVKISRYPPEMPVEMTMHDRLVELERLQELVDKAEANFPTEDIRVHAEWKQAKADLAKWRGELKKIIDTETDKLKKVDEEARKKTLKKIEGLRGKLKVAQEKQNATEIDKLKKDIEEESAKTWIPLTDVLTSAQKAQGPLPEPVRTPIASWRQLEWADAGVKWGLVALGACLMLGLLSRFTSLATALLILSFYLAMPPLPGWPESPRLEGHYLGVNKTLIEVVALLALTFIPTGRWAGVDGLLQFVMPSCCGGAKS